MSIVLEKPEQDALGLHRQERTFLADRLLSSLGSEEPGDVEAVWIIEAERRYREYKGGLREPIPASEVFAEADRLFE
uniref:Addiction module component n=1 Tax=Candidatus Kentrum sp. MB TaxID=2138164 RepID=A0A450X7Q1_9GAMM|nr:MAG: Putative addiction module component [Candidatus Kentron sp. MB]VFK31521.1 MAG: Putative addiction module component [Candidatus Kentron sp. MB]VFK75548.1 MAG: Putative addiction module component [Candidatus Kentron sp. MB]